MLDMSKVTNLQGPSMMCLLNFHEIQTIIELLWQLCFIVIALNTSLANSLRHQ